MGFLRKTFKKIGKGIKKIGRKIGKAFKSIIKPFAKVFGKLGPIGSIAMMMVMPGLGQMLAGFGAGTVTQTLGAFAGNAVKFVGNAINFVATAPQKILGSITNGITNAWNGLFTNPVTGGAKGGSWWNNFKTDMQNTWTSGGAIDAKGELIEGSKGNFFDYSKQGQVRIDNFKSDFTKSRGQIKDIFTKDKRTLLSESDVNTMVKEGQLSATEFDQLQKGTMKDFKLAPADKGVLGNLRQGAGETITKIKDVTVPGVGTVGDVAWGTNAGITAYNAYSSINPQEMEVLGGSGIGILAEEQLYSGDQGGMYNQTPPTWSYNQNMSVAQNQQNAVNAWNSNYGFPQGFDPYATPGYGFGYEQWLQQQMAA